MGGQLPLSLPFFDKSEEECETGFEVYGSIGKIAFYGTEEDIQSSC